VTGTERASREDLAIRDA